MLKLPIVTANTLKRFLRDKGFAQIRQKGSHKFFKHADGRTCTVPDHPGEDLGRGILHKILNDIEVDRQEFIGWLNNS